MPAYENLWTDELLAADPNFAIIKEQVSVANPFLGAVLAGQPERRRSTPSAPRAWSSRSVGNVICRAHDARRMPSKDAHEKIVEIFEEGGIMQP